MLSMNYKALVIALFVMIYLYHLFLTIVHMKSARNPIPVNVVDVYDMDTYQKWRDYHA